MYHKQRFATKKKNPNFIHNGDICFFKQAQQVFPSDESWDYTESIQRVIWPGEHLVYIKRMRKGRSNPWLHCFESYGLEYVYDGSIKDFTKKQIPYREDGSNER